MFSKFYTLNLSHKELKADQLKEKKASIKASKKKKKYKHTHFNSNPSDTTRQQKRCNDPNGTVTCVMFLCVLMLIITATVTIMTNDYS